MKNNFQMLRIKLVSYLQRFRRVVKVSVRLEDPLFSVYELNNLKELLVYGIIKYEG